MRAFSDDLRASARALPPGLFGEATCAKLLYDAFRLGLEAVLKPLPRDGRGRARDRRGVKVLEDISRGLLGAASQYLFGFFGACAGSAPVQETVEKYVSQYDANK